MYIQKIMKPKDAVRICTEQDIPDFLIDTIKIENNQIVCLAAEGFNYSPIGSVIGFDRNAPTSTGKGAWPLGEHSFIEKDGVFYPAPEIRVAEEIQAPYSLETEWGTQTLEIGQKGYLVTSPNGTQNILTLGTTSADDYMVCTKDGVNICQLNEMQGSESYKKMANLIATSIIGDFVLKRTEMKKKLSIDEIDELDRLWMLTARDYSDSGAMYVKAEGDTKPDTKLLIGSNLITKDFLVKNKTFYEFACIVQKVLEENQVLNFTEFGIHLDDYNEFKIKVAVSKNSIKVIESTEPVELNCETAEEYKYPCEGIKEQFGIVYDPNSEKYYGFPSEWEYVSGSRECNELKATAPECETVSIIYVKPIHLKLSDDLKDFITKGHWWCQDTSIYRLEDDLYWFQFLTWFDEFKCSDTTMFKRLEQLINECALNGEKFAVIEYGVTYDSEKDRDTQPHCIYNSRKSSKLSVF